MKETHHTDTHTARHTPQTLTDTHTATHTHFNPFLMRWLLFDPESLARPDQVLTFQLVQLTLRRGAYSVILRGLCLQTTHRDVCVCVCGGGCVWGWVCGGGCVCVCVCTSPGGWPDSTHPELEAAHQS